MKTRDRIIHSATELFNDQGERNITTNHIAAHLGISPGNLYYHFRNKEDIIHSIFDQYARHLSDSFTPIRSSEIRLEDLRDEPFLLYTQAFTLSERLGLARRFLAEPNAQKPR